MEQPDGHLPFAGTVRVSIPANYDRDNATLTYRLEATACASPRPRRCRRSTAARPSPRSTPRRPPARVPPTASSRSIRSATPPSNTVTVTVSSTGNRSAYTDAVLTTPGLTNYWRMGETSGAFADLVGNRPLTLTGSASRGVTGVVPNDNDRAVTLNGGYTYTNASAAAPQTFSVEAWFRTSNTGGGKILGYGSSRTGNSSSYDRHFYIGNDGRLRFGVNPGGVRVVTSPTSLLDNRWHHAVATVGNGVLSLYVDGQLVDQLTGVAGGETINGYWRVGGDNLSGWPNRPRAPPPARHDRRGRGVRQGAERRRRGTPLRGRHHRRRAEHPAGGCVHGDGDRSRLPWARRRPPTPTATITGYAWDFGDGGTGTGVTASRTYAAPAPTPSRSPSPTTAAPPAPPPSRSRCPTWRRTRRRRRRSPRRRWRSASPSASTSTDPDGTITGYAWDFGDGSTGTGVTASRTYAAPGAYTVTLTVTDDRGATGTTTQQVEVTDVAVPPQPFATDAFEREVTGGLGTCQALGARRLDDQLRGRWWPGPAADERRAGCVGIPPGHLHRHQCAPPWRSTIASPGSVFTSVVGRRVGTADYRAKVRFATNGRCRRSSPGSPAVRPTSSDSPCGSHRGPGEPVQVRFQVTGTSPTTLRLKVWRAGTPSRRLAALDDRRHRSAPGRWRRRVRHLPVEQRHRTRR
ncbi:MAG: PKD domain-containing protein [Ilumatobacteraceae bacterium]